MGVDVPWKLFSREKREWPTALFVANDQMAYGVLEVAEQQGIRIPEEIAIVGFDDNSLSAHIRPALTTIHQPFSEMGRKACEVLVTMIDADHNPEKACPKRPISQDPEHSLEAFHAANPTRIQLPTHLVVRTSSSQFPKLSSYWFVATSLVVLNKIDPTVCSF